MTTAVLNFGDTDETGAATRSVALNLPDGDLEGQDVTEALTAAGVTSADIRSRTILQVNDISAPDLAVLVSTLHGFTGRWVVTNLDGNLLDLPTLADNAPPAGPRPEEPSLEVIVMSTEALRADAPHARRAFLAESLGPANMLVALTILSVLRRRPSGERFPNVLTNDDEVVQLEDARRAGAHLRTSSRPSLEAPLAEKKPLADRIVRMQRAASVPIQSVLVRLGSHMDEESGKWRCPRPDRHSNGDSSPSMVVTGENTTQCFRCDPERVDAIRLVADTLDCTGDEAADWILAAQ